MVCQNRKSTKLRKSDLESAENFTKFVKGHCKSTHYTLQIKKCLSPEYNFCTTIQSPRMPIEKFKQLHFLPDPVLKTKDSYKSFEEVYGEETTDKDQPSLKSEKHNHLADDKYKRDGLFVSAKVKGVMVCGECNKSRCIYASKKLLKDEEGALARIREDGNYDCGSPLHDGRLLRNFLPRR